MLDKKKQASTFGVKLAIVSYYFLPRAQIVTASSYVNLAFDIRKLVVFFLTIGLFTVAFQKTYSTKWPNVNLARMVTGVYILYGFASIFYKMILEFI